MGEIAEAVLGKIQSPFSANEIDQSDFHITIFQVLFNVIESTNPNINRIGVLQQDVLQINNYTYGLTGNKLTVHVPVDLIKYPGCFALG